MIEGQTRPTTAITAVSPPQTALPSSEVYLRFRPVRPRNSVARGSMAYIEWVLYASGGGIFTRKIHEESLWPVTLANQKLNQGP